MLHHVTHIFDCFILFSLQQYYLSFWCLTGKNNVAQQDLHLCQYLSPKKCSDMNRSVTVAITITTWFKKCLLVRLSIANDEKSVSIFHFYYVAFFAFNYKYYFCVHAHTPQCDQVFLSGSLALSGIHLLRTIS